MRFLSEIYFAAAILGLWALMWLYHRYRALQKENSILNVMLDSVHSNCLGLDKLLKEYARELKNLRWDYDNQKKQQGQLVNLELQLNDLQTKHNYVLSENHKNILLAQENARVALNTFNTLQRIKKIAPEVVNRAEEQIIREQKLRRGINRQKARALKLVRKKNDKKEE